MTLYTSSFARSGKRPNAVATSRGVPRWFRGRVYDALRPSREMLRMTRADFDAAYATMLDSLDPNDVAADLGDGAILLCWERDVADCHRGDIGSWLRAAGHDVREVEPEHDPRLALFDTTEYESRNP